MAKAKAKRVRNNAEAFFIVSSAVLFEFSALKSSDRDFVPSLSPPSLLTVTNVNELWRVWDTGFGECDALLVSVCGVGCVSSNARSLHNRIHSSLPSPEVHQAVAIQHTHHLGLVNYSRFRYATPGASSLTGECLKTDLRPPFGLTSPPLAETAVPSVCSILIPSALIFVAALPSLS